MKASNLVSLLLLYLFCSCNYGNKPNVPKVSFGIYETVKVKDLPNSFIETLKNTNTKFENNVQVPVIGYIEKSDSMILHIDFSKENFKIVKTFSPVDQDGKYYALVAVKRSSLIENSDINNTNIKGQNVEIHFNLKGASKWADMTKNNIGNRVAFIIDNQICTMPVVNAEIKTGDAIINGIGDETIAKSISESLNSSIPK